MDTVIYLLLNYLNGCIQEDTNTMIAREILKHIHEFKGYSLAKCADACNVSESTLKRFCITVGFGGYGNLKDMLNRSEIITPPLENNEALMNQNYEAIESIAPSILHKVNDLIRYYDRVLIVGYGNFQYPAMYYQKQLFSLGKLVEVSHVFPGNMDVVKDADVLIIVSMGGRFVKDHYDKITKGKKVILITQCDKEYPCDIRLQLGKPTLDIYEKYDMLHIFDLLLNEFKKS